MKIVAYGEHALLIEVPDLDTVLGLYTALHDNPPQGVLDLVPAARTLLVILRLDANARSVAATLRATQPRPYASQPGPVVDVPVVYDGDDLADVARSVRLSPDDVIRRHCAPEYVVAFCGFLPGFGYLRGLDPGLHVPRRTTPRVRVPAGAVAIAGEYAAVYPRSAPGGWQLLGRTDLVLFDVERNPPAVLTPATRVRFHPVIS